MQACLGLLATNGGGGGEGVEEEMGRRRRGGRGGEGEEEERGLLATNVSTVTGRNFTECLINITQNLLTIT